LNNYVAGNFFLKINSYNKYKISGFKIEGKIILAQRQERICK